MDKKHKYNLEEKVHLSYGDLKRGIVDEILIDEELRITKDGKEYSRDVEYFVRFNDGSYSSHDEDELKPLKKPYPKISFKVKRGQIILIEDKEYLVESAGKRKHYAFLGPDFCGSSEMTAWHIKARKLSNKEYNPKGKLISFDQEKGEPIEIVRKMKVNYK